MSDTLAPAWARGPLRPFRFRQYRCLAASITFELAAAGVWLIALVWQVIELRGGPGNLSFVASGTALGLVLTVLVGGVAADRIPQRRVMVAVTVVRVAVTAVVSALALAGLVTFWHLALAGLVLGLASGFYFPAYSAILPSVVDADDLLAANGMEGVLRPVMMNAAGPALASLVVAAWSPAWAFVLVLALEVGCLLTILLLHPVPLRRDLVADDTHPVRAAAADLVIGFRYMVSTPWLLATLLFASAMVLVVIGPLEVLVPFVIKDQAGGDATDHAWVLAAFGLGGAAASLLMASIRMPRRYLTIMVAMWGAACLPMAVVGFATSVPLIAAALLITGALFSAPTVIWGTLLQRRVPAELLGRVSSLDFFVSLAFMPVSMALAGAVGELIGLKATFLVAGVAPIFLAVAAIALARMPVDEIDHPLG
ncbi:MFS transporter [Aeromicrobium marinum]|uniref:MFS transporter n=1 Tax=Aeromicrobium marinum TaxID=219314 RepID=UPI001B7F8690|nr:MFS transporter [Aeromicrobium marinum]